MIRELTVYETCDGKRHDDERKAHEHVADAVRSVLDARLQPLQDEGRLSANDRYRVVMAIIPDAAAAAQLHAALARWLTY
jgi:hypothetical protein